MRRISAFFISLLVILISGPAAGQDTVRFPLKIRIGADIAGPGLYFADKNNLDIEGFLSYDRNEKMSYVVEGGSLNYKYSQYNYDYMTKGIFTRVGVDFNLLKPKVSEGKYWAGIGLRYGLSIFNTQTPLFRYENYWDTVVSSIPKRTSAGHFLEVSPGVRTELFRNFSMGWIIRLRLLISGGGGKDLRPIYFPGYGPGGNNVSAGINYYLVWSIPYRIKTVITKPPPPPEPEEAPEVPQQSNELFR